MHASTLALLRRFALGAVLWTAALASGLFALTSLGETSAPGEPPTALIAAALALVAGVAGVRHAIRTPEPFLDPRLFRNRVFSGAMLLSLLTGYALATAIVRPVFLRAKKTRAAPARLSAAKVRKLVEIP